MKKARSLTGPFSSGLHHRFLGFRITQPVELMLHLEGAAREGQSERGLIDIGLIEACAVFRVIYYGNDFDLDASAAQIKLQVYIVGPLPVVGRLQ